MVRVRGWGGRSTLMDEHRVPSSRARGRRQERPPGRGARQERCADNLSSSSLVQALQDLRTARTIKGSRGERDTLPLRAPGFFSTLWLESQPCVDGLGRPCVETGACSGEPEVIAGVGPHLWCFMCTLAEPFPFLRCCPLWQPLAPQGHLNVNVLNLKLTLN